MGGADPDGACGLGRLKDECVCVPPRHGQRIAAGGASPVADDDPVRALVPGRAFAGPDRVAQPFLQARVKRVLRRFADFQADGVRVQQTHGLPTDEFGLTLDHEDDRIVSQIGVRPV